MDQNPILFNTQIEGLPLAFNLGFEKWGLGGALVLSSPGIPGGRQIPGGMGPMLGYVNFQIHHHSPSSLLLKGNFEN